MRNYSINSMQGKTSKLNMHYVYINDRFVTAYLNKADALQKIANDLNNYRNCESETVVKNVMFHSNKNYHNSIV